jgi:hypothetical protein
VVKRVDRIIELSKNLSNKTNYKIAKEIERLEKDINHIIYSHYSLGKEEQKIIEESLE